ncbi:hypothetical protein [Paraliomyxa miuraensis]|uniref:hypothetical protein n=1 Tax=Paraliomyxa miuraensis TaxID=376150 RepID=UPI002259CBCB|nr:hypothetical protein [Paraliomyxa miuraensis]MCX4244571.1 hypothetical protein [Paraliomyxa miuraensis]
MARRNRQWLAAALGALAVLGASPAVPAPATPGGYWLSVDLVGPAAAQQQAATELAGDLVLREPADVAPPGLLLGHVDEVSQALRWIDDYAFEPRLHMPAELLALHQGPAPAPAGGLIDRHGVIAAAFIVSGATEQLRPREIAWPLDQAAVLPPDSTWIPAALVPDHAPLFAAPAPVVPPASERFGMVHRRGGLFVVGVVDRCTQTRSDASCLRWAAVVARNGDRFTPGYLPMMQVAPTDAWVRGEGDLPRAQLVAIGLAAGQAQWLLLARGRDDQLHRRTLAAPARDGGWPRSHLRVEGDLALVELGLEPTLSLALDATLDARPPRPPATEGTTGAHEEEHDDE